MSSRSDIDIESNPIVTSPLRVLASRPVWAGLILLSLAALPEPFPALRSLRTLGTPETLSFLHVERVEAEPVAGEAELEQETRSDVAAVDSESAQGPTAPAGVLAQPSNTPGELASINVKKPPRPIEDASGHALDAFFASLLRTQQRQGKAITRILHFGDSLIVSDYVSSTLRRELQQQFGDAGHGFVLMANAWPAYFHNDVFRFSSAGFKVSRIVGPYADDGLYGLGGVSFRAPAGVRARFGTAKSGDFGRKVARFTLAYLVEPGGGKLRLSLDGGAPLEVDSSGPEKKSAFVSVVADDGEHELEVLTGPGSTRSFGVVLERDQPGVVLDALGVQGARIRFLDKADDQHWAEQLAWRAPNLLIYQFGANESSDGYLYPMEDYFRTMQAVLDQGQRAVPEASCLVIGAMDRASKHGEELLSLRVMPDLLRQQQRAAQAAGCAFFDTFNAMGGRGSMPIWVRRGLAQADFTHPTGAGAEVIGKWIYRALLEGYTDYVKRAGPTRSDSPASQ